MKCIFCGKEFDENNHGYEITLGVGPVHSYSSNYMGIFRRGFCSSSCAYSAADKIIEDEVNRQQGKL